MLYKEIEPALFRRAVAGDEKARLELVEGFWDRQYLRKYGLPKVPGIKWPQGPQPDPSPELMGFLAGDPDPEPMRYRLDLYDHILSGLINIAAGDPDPQPSIVGLLVDPHVRLASAKQLIPRLNKAIDGIGREIESLEKSLGNQRPRV